MTLKKINETLNIILLNFSTVCEIINNEMSFYFRMGMNQFSSSCKIVEVFIEKQTKTMRTLGKVVSESKTSGRFY